MPVVQKISPGVGYRLPAAGELLKVEDFLLTTGGCAANTGMDLARLGVSTTVIGKVGEDSFGDFVVGDLARHGLDTRGIRRSTQGTSRTVILPVVGEDRRYIHAVGANGDFTAADIDRQQVLASQVLYVGGYMLLPHLEAGSLAGLFTAARQAGVKTVLDVAGVTQPAWEELSQLLPHVDVFLPNHDEACILTGETDPVRQAAVLLDLGAGAEIDFLTFRNLVSKAPKQSTLEAQIRMYEQAITLYTGEFLKEDSFEDWSSFERESLKELYINTVTTVGNYYLSQGNTTQATLHARKILDIDRVQDDGYELLFTSLAAAGNISELAKSWALCQAAYRREFLSHPPKHLAALAGDI